MLLLKFYSYEYLLSYFHLSCKGIILYTVLYVLHYPLNSVTWVSSQTGTWGFQTLGFTVAQYSISEAKKFS